MVNHNKREHIDCYLKWELAMQMRRETKKYIPMDDMLLILRDVTDKTAWTIKLQTETELHYPERKSKKDLDFN